MTEPASEPEPLQLEQIELEGDWSDGFSKPALPANVFAVQLGSPSGSGTPDGIYLWAGSMAPPLLTGSKDRVKRTLDQLNGELPVTVHAKLLLTRDRAEELVNLLSNAVANFDRIVSSNSSQESE